MDNVILTDQYMAEYTIRDSDEILEMYKVHDQNFSDHIALDVVLKIFIFVKQMANQIDKYYNFLMEKNENLKRLKEIKNPQEREELCIWEFLNQIMIRVEIVHRQSEEEDMDEA